MIYRAYRYCFYHFYNYGLRKWGEKSYPQYWAAFVVATFAVINIYTLLIIIELVAKIKVFSTFVLNEQIRLVGIILIFWLHHSLFVGNGRYRAIFKEFSKEKESGSQKKRATYLGIYTLISVVGIFVSGWAFVVS